jgi:V8-like Glu-specific endopeptidase
MDRKRPGSKTAKAESPARGEAAVRAAADRADDPLFVPRVESLGLEGAGLASLEDFEAPGDQYPLVLETICGALDDSQPVEQYDGTLGVPAAFVAAHQSAVCQVQWNSNLASVYTNPGNVSGARWGTGTMVSADIMLTCGHLFDQTGGGWERPRQNGTTNIISPQEIARNMKVNFNFQVDASGNPRPEQSFAITELIEYRLDGIDMAVCRIAGNPGATFGTTPISTTDASTPDMICIIGHPAGQRKRIEAGPTTAIDGSLIRYNDIDTLGGNSGSGILRASDGRLVGVHTNGGCNPQGTGSNFGQRIEAVRAASPTLRSLGRVVKPGLDPKMKFRDDIKPVIDVKRKLQDDIKPNLDPKLKIRDDPKLPQLDKSPAQDLPKGRDIPDPGGFRPRPGFAGGGGGGARPFILATPHHSTAWAAGGESVDELEASLQELEQELVAGQAELAQLYDVYAQLLAQYHQAGGGG